MAVIFYASVSNDSDNDMGEEIISIKYSALISNFADYLKPLLLIGEYEQ